MVWSIDVHKPIDNIRDKLSYQRQGLNKGTPQYKSTRVVGVQHQGSFSVLQGLEVKNHKSRSTKY